MSRQLKSVKSNPLASRIKKVMQADEDVGKIAQGAPVLVSRAVEMFLANLCEGTAGITAVHFRKAYVTSAPKLDFLADKFTAVPDLVEADTAKEAPTKKHRGGSDPANNSDRSLSSPPTSSGRSGRGRGRTRGRGSVRLSAQDSRVGQIKSEHHHAESDVAMLDTKHEQIKQEGGDADQQPAVSVKAEDSNAQQEPSQAAAGQSVSHQIALSTAETQQDEQPVLSSPAQSNKLQQSGVPSSAQEQLSSPKGDPQQSVQPPSHVPNLQSLSSAGGLSLPRTSLEMLPEEDDYDADE